MNTDYKNNNDRNFQFTKFSYIDSVLTDRRSLSGKRPKSASGKSSSCRFSFSAANVNTKATEYVSCGFSFCILVLFPLLEKFEPHYCNNTAIHTFKRFLNRHLISIKCLQGTNENWIYNESSSTCKWNSTQDVKITIL